MSHSTAILLLAFLSGAFLGTMSGAVLTVLFVSRIARMGRETRLAQDQQRMESRGKVWVAWDRDKDEAGDPE